MKRVFPVIICTLLFMYSCVPSPIELTATANIALEQTQTAAPTKTLTPTLTPTSTRTMTPTSTPTATPTPLGGGSGTIIFSDGWTLFSINIDGTDKKLIDGNCQWNLTFSPNGQYMTCSVHKNIGDNSHGGFGVILIDLETHKVIKRFAESKLLTYSDHGYGWSPDSKRFAFFGTDDNQTGLYEINSDSSTVELLYKTPYVGNTPYTGTLVWSHDGSKILFFESFDSNYYVVNSDGTNLVKINQEHTSSWTNSIAWGDNTDTVFINGQGIDLQTLQPNGETTTQQQDDDQIAITVSPDGKWQVITNYSKRKVFLQSKDGSQKIDITEKRMIDFSDLKPTYLQWSPDSRNLSYYIEGQRSIFWAPIDTLIASRLIEVKGNKQNEYHYYYGKFLWLPDGKHIIFVQAYGNDDYQVCLANLSSGEISPLFITDNPVGINIQPTRP